MNASNTECRNSIHRSATLCAFPLIGVAFVCFGVLPISHAITPAPDGGYPGNTTAEGTDALFSLAGGLGNTAIGFDALYNDTIGFSNTAIGTNALRSNTIAGSNTAVGDAALLSNTTGQVNTAIGRDSLRSNTTANYNTTTGWASLYYNTVGELNTADGALALLFNTGNNNIGLGQYAGGNLTTGDNNIDIANAGVPGESNTIRIGDQAANNAVFIAGINGVDMSSGKAVFVNANGQLGTADVSGLLWPKGSILEMQPGSTPPAGFTKIGTEQAKFYDLSGHPSQVTWDVYQKN
jgi:hypothetical protein